MAVCPVCNKPIELMDKHMGALFNCPHCRAVFFVGWDGQPEMSQPDPPEPVQETIIAIPGNADEAARAPYATNDFVAVDVGAGEEPREASLSFNSGVLGDPNEPAQAIPDSAFDASDFQNPPPTAESAPEEEQPYSFEQPLGASTPVSGLPNPAADNFNDVTDFANSEQSTGPLTYFVAIRGLELAETFLRLKEALTDSRFGWDADEVVGHSNNGELILRGLNPTKAAILVSRIKDLPIELSWHQEVYGEIS